MTDLDTARQTGADQRPNPSTDDDRRRWARDVSAALDTLDARSAAALRLIYHSHTTQAQAAAHLGLPETEVRTLVARGLQGLTAHLDSAAREAALRDATPRRPGHEPSQHRNV